VVRVPAWLDALAEGIATVHPGLPVTARAFAGRPAAALRALSRAGSLLVLGARGHGEHRLWAAGSVCHPLLEGAACPVLVAGRGHGGGSHLVVVHIADGDLPDPSAEVPTVDVGVAQAVRRGADLLLLHPYERRPEEEDAAALRRARTWTSRMMQLLGGPGGRLPGVVVSSVHTTQPHAAALVDHGQGAELVVVGAGAPDRHVAAALDVLPCSVVVVPPAVADRREGCRAAYRQALLEELARHPDRADGCTTPEELDDAWRVGVASPAVGDRVPLTWRACLQRAATAVPGGRSRGVP
jgi:hypothetical protein